MIRRFVSVCWRCSCVRRAGASRSSARCRPKIPKRSAPAASWSKPASTTTATSTAGVRTARQPVHGAGVRGQPRRQLDCRDPDRLAASIRSSPSPSRCPDAPLSTLLQLDGDSTDDFGDIHIGAKVRFLRETASRPAIGSSVFDAPAERRQRVGPGQGRAGLLVGAERSARRFNRFASSPTSAC